MQAIRGLLSHGFRLGMSMAGNSEASQGFEKVMEGSLTGWAYLQIDDRAFGLLGASC